MAGTSVTFCHRDKTPDESNCGKRGLFWLRVLEDTVHHGRKDTGEGLVCGDGDLQSLFLSSANLKPESMGRK